MRALFSAICLLLLFAGPASASSERTYGNLYHAEYLGTREVDLAIFEIAGVHPLLGDQIEVRFRGIDAPARAARCERERRLAEQARQVVDSLLGKARTIVLKDVARGRGFRIRATVLADSTEVGEVLVKKGLAQPWQRGEPRRNWCE